MKAIPVPVRERILHLYDQGKSTRDIAQSLGYCAAAVRRVRQQFKERGTLEPRTHLCGRKTLLTPRRKKRLQALVARQPDATLVELGAQFKRPTSTMDLWLNRLGLSCKKNAARRRAVTARRSGAKEAMAATAGGGAGHTPGVCRRKRGQHPYDPALRT
jgi:transposase